MDGTFTTQIQVIVPVDRAKMRELRIRKMPVALFVTPEGKRTMIAYGDATAKIEFKLRGKTQ